MRLYLVNVIYKYVYADGNHYSLGNGFAGSYMPGSDRFTLLQYIIRTPLGALLILRQFLPMDPSLL